MSPDGDSSWVADWTVDPFVSFGPLRLRASREEVRQAIGETPHEFLKGENPTPVETYEGAGIHAYYDSEGLLEFVEAFPPCSPVYAGIDLLAPDAGSVVRQLRDLGLESREDAEGGIWFEDHGFALYAPSGVSEGVSVFTRGYDTGA